MQKATKATSTAAPSTLNFMGPMSKNSAIFLLGFTRGTGGSWKCPQHFDLQVCLGAEETTCWEQLRETMVKTVVETQEMIFIHLDLPYLTVGHGRSPVETPNGIPFVLFSYPRLRRLPPHISCDPQGVVAFLLTSINLSCRGVVNQVLRFQLQNLLLPFTINLSLTIQSFINWVIQPNFCRSFSAFGLDPVGVGAPCEMMAEIGCNPCQLEWAP